MTEYNSKLILVFGCQKCLNLQTDCLVQSCQNRENAKYCRHSSKNRSSQELKQNIFLTIWASTAANGSCTRTIFFGDKSTITACFTINLSNLILVKTSCDEKYYKFGTNLFPCFNNSIKLLLNLIKGRSNQDRLYQIYFTHIVMICGRIFEKLLLHMPEKV